MVVWRRDWDGRKDKSCSSHDLSAVMNRVLAKDNGIDARFAVCLKLGLGYGRL